ncbi:putative F-box protein At3g16210 isoform X1 [Papaver somniferum]|uniref:putative F-box protein At3g16210 isoform X1 n=1 Tax=Papaver somniferum TaxID=3469 RepID=UPI000E6F67D8|nr:putative F-box protein At3g16210 isoform X1 [Papaver somniferum]
MVRIHPCSSCIQRKLSSLPLTIEWIWFLLQGTIMTISKDFVGASNGLIWIWLFDYTGARDSLCLWNPATREYKQIPNPSGEFNRHHVVLHNFCYDHKIDDYKLAICEAVYGGNSLLHVYTLASNSWKVGKKATYRFPYNMERRGVLVNADFHWLAVAEYKYFLLSLDISDESFKEMQLPKEFLTTKDPHMVLGELEGCLCLLMRSYVNGVKIQLEVWEMLEFGVPEAWTKRYIISRESIISDQFFLRNAWSFKNAEILFLGRTSLVLYDPKDGNVTEFKIDNTYYHYAENYFESLVS